ncbi:MAG: nucleotidyltransferase domain-containing protein, partial [Saprospiraceae bacterium]|nr:nucleotidyltransferase domain-containing protein [Saprospiraceae bacterium]
MLSNLIVSKIAKTIHDNDPLAEAYLFGSRARGDAELDSDMDVIVIVDDLAEKDEDYISECAWEAGFESGIVV